jgi:O-antigen ligase
MMRNFPLMPVLPLALYVHGLTFYFCIAGIIGAHSTVLTGLYQFGTVFLVALYALLNPAARANLFKLEVVDILYLLFVALVAFDYFYTPNKSEFPANVAIYFPIYWVTFFLARSLNTSQFTRFCYLASLITMATSTILFAQVATNTASWVANGARLAAGSSGNPILTGYTGAFACCSGLVLSIRTQSAWRLVWLLGAIPGLLVCTMSGTRSATIAVALALICLIPYSMGVIARSRATWNRFVFNAMAAAGLIILLFLGSSMLEPPPTTASNAQNSPPLVETLNKALDSTTKRLKALTGTLSGGDGDRSIQEREEFYNKSWQGFLQNPITGGGLYSVGAAHNAVLQVAAEFGLLGMLTFLMPLLWLGYQLWRQVLISMAQPDPVQSSKNQLQESSDTFINTSCAVIFYIQAVCILLFHGDPYRSYLPVVSLGLVIAFLRKQTDQRRRIVFIPQIPLHSRT